MAFTLGRTRKAEALRQGDIVNLRVPFEENTRDYYNGYKPTEIRDKPFTDRFGKSSKVRMVIFIGRDDDTIYYLPVTSKNSIHDLDHQYELKDTFMMPTPEDGRMKRSFVEVDSVRALRVSPQRELSYTGYITKKDLSNIMHRIANNTLQFNGQRDKRGYVPPSMQKTFENELKQRGYEKTVNEPDKLVYEKKETGQMVRETSDGLVHYHYQKTKEQVRALVSLREGHTIRPPSNERVRDGTETEFQSSVKDLSNYQRERDKTYVTAY